MTPGFMTVGHSTRSFEEFADMLGCAQISLIVDVRSFPRSRSNPDYNSDTLPGRLEPHQIGYVHAPDLGGRRAIQKDVPEDTNALWRNRSFQNYADYALGDAFGSAFADLLDLGARHRLAIMCAEAVWWRCHRRIIADYLLLNDNAILHLMGKGREDTAKTTPGAERRPDGKVVYPASPETTNT